MRRPLIAVLSVLVAATFASGHPAAKSARGQARKLESVNACMKYRQQKLVEDGGLRMELRNCCHGPVRCAISWEVRCGKDGKPEPKSADLEISAGATESAYGYGTACGNDGWRIAGIKWNCETAGGDEVPSGEI